MGGPLDGVRVLEVASHVFAPMAGAVLAEWGAEVIKVEHPETGDPYRGLVTAGLHKVHAGADVQFQAANRGKRSVGLDLKHPEGRALLSKLVGAADVFVTNLRAPVVARLRLGAEDLRAENPSLIYVRATAFGPAGPDGGRGGYDAGAYWARSGMQHILASPAGGWPYPPPAAFGDVVGGITIAGAISTALYRRATTGAPSVIDASLLASGMWQIQMEVTNACIDPPETSPTALPDTAPAFPDTAPALPDTDPTVQDRYQAANPLMLAYRTSDGRFIVLQLLASDRHWPDLCRALGEPEMATDSRFADMAARKQNARACVTWLDEVFARRDFAEWRRILADFEGEWVPSLRPDELSEDPQVVANRYLTDVDLGNGHSLPLVAVPVRFDGHPPQSTRAPEPGEHTEAVLRELGLSWEQIGELKDRKAIQ